MKATANAEIFQLPRRNSCFCGRESELQTIAELLNNTKNGCSESAICGLGGVGKTSLAVEFLWRQKDKKEYPGGIFWISGENNKLFQLSVSEMARQVGTFDDEDFSNSLLRTLDWLRVRKQLWCLVVDNLDELEMSMDMRKLLTGHWKQAARGHIIMTTRREAKEIGEETGIKESSCIELKCLTDKEGVQFLRIRSEITGEDDDFRELVQELGGLPLALDQAAAYIRCVPHSTVKEYVIKYKEKRLRLLDKRKARHLVENTSRERLAVTTTWQLNFDHVRRISKEEDLGEIPALVMHISAYLGPDDIPFEVINEELNKVDNAEAAGDVWDSGDIVSLLTRFSLFQGYRTKSFSVHRLVQEVIRGEIKRKQTEFRVLSCAVRVLHHALATTRSPAEVCRSFSESAVFRVENPPSLRLWGKLASHATYLQEHLCSFSKKHRGEAEGLLHTEEAVRLLNDAGIFFSVSQEKVKAQEMQGMKLEMLVNLERSTLEEAPDDLPHYFIDAPLKHRNYKVISCCMRQPLSEEETLADQDSCRIGKREEANKLRENGNVAIESKKYEEAFNLYSKAIDLSSGDYRLFFNRALCHLKLNKPESALDDCRRCLSLNPNNSKALHRKAWALRELVKSGQSQRIGEERAAVAMALHFDPSLKQDKQFCEIFPKVQEMRIREISNETQLAFALMTTQDNETWLLREEQYSVMEFIVFSDLQIVGLGSKTILNCTELCLVSQASLYVESIVFQKGSSSLTCLGKEGAIHTVKCVFSGGLSSCEDYPECNGGPGCKMSSSGKTACDRTGKFGNSDTKSGIVGAPGVMILEGSSALLEDCKIHNCGGGGALVAGKGSRLFVRTCEVYRNHQAGLEAREGGELVASRNEIFDGNHHGILIGPDAGECEIRDNAIFENSREGIYAEQNKATVIIQGNDIHHNGPFGISLDSNSKILISNNNIFENGFWGILAKSRTSGCIKGNSLSGNKCGGIFIGVNYSGRIYLESNVVRDHAGPWLEYQSTKFILQPSGGMAKDLPAGEKEFYSVGPILSGNEECNNEEGMYHPREVLERPYSGCTYCHRSRAAVQYLRKCPSCHIASYCSKECQRKHRSKHKTLCLALKSRYSVTIELIPYVPETLGNSVLSMRTFGSHLKGIGEGPKLKRDSCDKFIVKVQTGTLNTHPLQKLTVYDQSLSIDAFIQSPDIFNVIWECGVLGALHKFTIKKVFFWAMFAEGGKKLTIFLDHLAPYQEW
ncbi:uncharacterized protein LOC111336907 [Stylophora pistillata]|nr:uncharacterized protein LOC111336907 [Stylophora pistillata]